MAKLLFLAAFAAICVIGNARHTHPRNVHMEEDSTSDLDLIAANIDGIPIEVISHIKTNRFVPVNNILFFRRYPPCEEGFERDLLGVCREVWD